MKAIWLVLLVPFLYADEAADRTAIRQAISTFNDTYERKSVLAPNADLPDLSRCWGLEISQIYFEMAAVRFVTRDVALADAHANRYQRIGKQTGEAFFVLKREGGVWKIDSLRMLTNSCLTIVPLGR
jgi:hypothetical protein